MPLHAAVIARLNHALGPFMAANGRGRMWCVDARAGGKPVIVLLTGAPEPVSVWVFDPHNAFDGVHIEVVRAKAAITPLILLIQELCDQPRC